MSILIYGTGTMGIGIAQTFVQNHYSVIMYNPNIGSSKLALECIGNNLSKLVSKGKISQESKETYLSKIDIIDSLEKAYDVSLAIEAVSENIELKKATFIELDKILNKEVIIASNTSSLSITELALATSRPDKVVGMHFFNPATIMELVEVVSGMTTSINTVEYVKSISEKLGKRPVLVNEAPGFIVNRMLIPMINEAISIYTQGVASKEDIDTAMKNGANHPIGPFALADLIGLDICLNIMDILHSEMGSDKYCAHPLLRKMVRANKLGRKTKVGFYKY